MTVVAVLHSIEDVDQVIDVRQDSDGDGYGDRQGLAGRGPNCPSEAARDDGMDYRPQRLTSSYRKSGSETLRSCECKGLSGPMLLGEDDVTYIVRVVEHVVRLVMFKGPLLTVV